MNECNTWQCINSFAAWFSAGGTILISSVALWLSLRDKLIRVRATFSGALIASYDPMKLDTYVYSLNFVNVGARDVSITNFEWRTKDFPFKKSCRIFIQPYLDERVSRFCTRLPLKLGDGESGQIFFASDFIEIMDEPNQFLFNENKLIAFMRIFMSEIYLCTSIGSVIKVQMRLEIKKELWGKYIAAMHKPKVRSK